MISKHALNPFTSGIVIPGTCVAILGQGVLFKGDSATGKSLLSLELIHRGHKLVADDAVQLDVKNLQIFASCPPQIQDFMYLKELGIINVRKMFGSSAICLQTELKLVIQLSTDMEQTYLANPYKIDSILNVDIPTLTVPAHLTHAILIETAVRDLLLKANGYFAFDEFNHQHQQFMNPLKTKNYDC